MPDEARLQERVRILAEQVARAYREIAATSMADVPICNPALGVAAEGFRIHAGRAVGAVVTPWFLNVVALDIPGEALSPSAPVGAASSLATPAGEIAMLVGELPGLGRIDSCSLFSPMQEFADMPAALETAREAMRALFAMETPQAPSLDRRAFLRGRHWAGAGAGA